MSSGNKEAYRGRKKIKYLDKIDILDLLDQNSNHKRVKLMYVNDETSEVDIIVDKNESSMFCLSNTLFFFIRTSKNGLRLSCS